MPDLRDFMENNPDSPFRDPQPGEDPYIDPAVMRAFATAINDAVSNWHAEYQFSTTITEGAASGQMRMDNADQPSATKIWLNYQSSESIDQSLVLKQLNMNNRLYIQDKNESARWHRFDITSFAVDKSTYVELPVSFLEGGMALVGQAVIVRFYTVTAT